MLFNKQNIVKIYKITNLINGKIYIGQTKNDVTKRFARHKNDAKHNSQLFLHRAMRKYGYENFNLEQILTCCDIEEAYIMETLLINKANSINERIGYNIRVGGNVPPSRRGKNHPQYGIKWTEEQKEKLRISQSKIDHTIVSKETKNKLKENAKNMWRNGLLKKRTRSIICNETGKVYGSISDAAREIGRDPTNIVFQIKHPNRKCNGLTFKYTSEESL